MHRPRRLARHLVVGLIGVLVGAVPIAIAQEAVGPTAANPGAPTRKDRLRQLLKEQDEKSADLSAALRDLKPGPEQDGIIAQLTEIRVEYAARVLDLAREDPRDEIAFLAAFIAFRNGSGRQPTADTADFIVNRLADDVRAVPIMPQLVHTDGGVDLLARLAEKTTSREIRAAARFALLDAEVYGIDHPPKPLSEGEAGPRLAAAADRLRQFAAEYEGVTVSTRLGPSVSEAARRRVAYIETLTVGKPAIDFECERVDGARARLGDFRGQIVVLDFWATWCGSCRAMLPHERGLVERLKGRPFRLVSVSVDDTKSALTEFLKNEPMPWTQLWNGPSGGVVDTYELETFPTIYVLDASGTIRFKNIRGEDLDRAVDALLKEMDEGKRAP